jgi:hypothetical protein
MKKISYYFLFGFYSFYLIVMAWYLGHKTDFNMALLVMLAALTIHAHLFAVRSDVLKSIEELKEKKGNENKVASAQGFGDRGEEKDGTAH